MTFKSIEKYPITFLKFLTYSVIVEIDFYFFFNENYCIDGCNTSKTLNSNDFINKYIKKLIFMFFIYYLLFFITEKKV